jgi:hypothetical protein
MDKFEVKITLHCLTLLQIYHSYHHHQMLYVFEISYFLISIYNSLITMIIF